MKEECNFIRLHPSLFLTSLHVSAKSFGDTLILFLCRTETIPFTSMQMK